MARARKIAIEIVGDSSKLENAFDRAGKKGERFSKSFGVSMRNLGKAAALGAGAAGIGLVTKGLMSSVSAAKESQVASAQLAQAMRASGNSFKKYGTQIDAAIQKTSKLAALDDEELSGSFAKLVRTTGSVTKATKGMALAANIARARNISLESATKFVEKAMMGQVAALRRVGVEANNVTSTQEAVKFKYRELERTLTGGLTPALKRQMDIEMEAAKARDKHLTQIYALRDATSQFGGAAAKYGQTAAGAQERFGIAIENLQEKIGEKLLPVLTDLTIWATRWVEKVERDWPKIEQKALAVRDAFKRVHETLKPLINLTPGGEGTFFGVLIGGVLAAKLAAATMNVIALNRALLITAARLAPVIAGLVLIQDLQSKGPRGWLEENWKRVLMPGYSDLLDQAMKNAWRVLPGGDTKSPQVTPTPDARRAVGGPVRPGGSYLVGERGPEILTMGRMGGNVLAGSGGINITGPIHIYGVQDIPSLANELRRLAARSGSQSRGQFGGQSLAFN